MSKSFAEILNEQLRPKPAVAADSRTFAQEIPSLRYWELSARHFEKPRPRLNQIYPTPPCIKNSTFTRPREPMLAASALLQSDLAALRTMENFGASELHDGFSTTTLKAAFRRLAKRLHPDHSPKTAAQFLELRAAYLQLLKLSLDRGSESASAPASPPRAAA